MDNSLSLLHLAFSLSQPSLLVPLRIMAAMQFVGDILYTEIFMTE
jgi:hypothetical protein